MSIPNPTPVDEAQNPAKEIFPVFPPELEREIFLLTARTYRGVSIRLMLVASRVKSWIEPFVYKTVLLRGPEHSMQFLTALINDRPLAPEFARSHVKALCIHPSVPVKLATELLTLCSGLESLALWIPPESGTIDLLNVLSSLPLTFLSFGLVFIHTTNYWKPASQDHPISFNLTHLDIVDHWIPWKSTHGIQHLPLLTHLAIRFWPHGTVSTAFLKILRESPNLRVFVLLTSSVAIRGGTEYLDKRGVQDIRVVVLKHARDVDDWESMERDSMTMWDRADIIVRWRQRTRAGPFDFPPGLLFGSEEAPSESTP